MIRKALQNRIAKARHNQIAEALKASLTTCPAAAVIVSELGLHTLRVQHFLLKQYTLKWLASTARDSGVGRGPLST